MADRLYQSEEIKKILARATELQQEPSGVDKGSGLSLSELQEVAASSGIDPALIERAALDVTLPAAARGSSTSTHLLTERVVPGELTDDLWQAVVIELRRRFETGGEDNDEVIATLGTTRSWRHLSDEEVTTQVYVTPQGGKLHVKMSQKIAWASRGVESSVWSVVATVIFGSLLAGLTDSTLFSVLAYVLTFMAAFPTIFAVDTAWRRSKQKDFDALADTLAHTLAQPQSVNVASGIAPAGAHRGELSVPDDHAWAEDAESIAQKRRGSTSV